jgi:hypothetical protein
MAPLSPNLMTLNFFLWSCIKDLMNSRRVNTLDEQKAYITMAVANVTKDVLQCI